MARFWLCWSQLMTSAVVTSSICSRGPRCTIAPAAFAQLRICVELFEGARVHTPRLNYVMPTLYRLQDTAYKSIIAVGPGMRHIPPPAGKPETVLGPGAASASNPLTLAPSNKNETSNKKSNSITNTSKRRSSGNQEIIELDGDEEDTNGKNDDTTDALAAYGGRARVIHRESATRKPLKSNSSGGSLNENPLGVLVPPRKSSNGPSSATSNANTNGNGQQRRPFKSSLWFDANFENRSNDSVFVSPSATSGQNVMSTFTNGTGNSGMNGSNSTSPSSATQANGQQAHPFMYLQDSMGTNGQSNSDSSGSNRASHSPSFGDARPGLVQSLAADGEAGGDAMVTDDYSWLNGFGSPQDSSQAQAQNQQMQSPETLSPFQFANFSSLGNSIGMSAMGYLPNNNSNNPSSTQNINFNNITPDQISNMANFVPMNGLSGMNNLSSLGLAGVNASDIGMNLGLGGFGGLGTGMGLGGMGVGGMSTGMNVDFGGMNNVGGGGNGGGSKTINGTDGTITPAGARFGGGGQQGPNIGDMRMSVGDLFGDVDGRYNGMQQGSSSSSNVTNSTNVGGDRASPNINRSGSGSGGGSGTPLNGGSGNLGSMGSDSLPPGMFGYSHLLGGGGGSGGQEQSQNPSTTSTSATAAFSSLFPQQTTSLNRSNQNTINGGGNSNNANDANSWFFSNFSSTESPPQMTSQSFDMNVDMVDPTMNNMSTGGSLRGNKVSEPALHDASWQEYMRRVFVSGGSGNVAGSNGENSNGDAVAW